MEAPTGGLNLPDTPSSAALAGRLLQHLNSSPRTPSNEEIAQYVAKMFSEIQGDVDRIIASASSSSSGVDPAALTQAFADGGRRSALSSLGPALQQDMEAAHGHVPVQAAMQAPSALAAQSAANTSGQETEQQQQQPAQPEAQFLSAKTTPYNSARASPEVWSEAPERPAVQLRARYSEATQTMSDLPCGRGAFSLPEAFESDTDEDEQFYSDGASMASESAYASPRQELGAEADAGSGARAPSRLGREQQAAAQAKHQLMMGQQGPTDAAGRNGAVNRRPDDDSDDEQGLQRAGLAVAGQPAVLSADGTARQQQRQQAAALTGGSFSGVALSDQAQQAGPNTNTGLLQPVTAAFSTGNSLPGVRQSPATLDMGPAAAAAAAAPARLNLSKENFSRAGLLASRDNSPARGQSPVPAVNTAAASKAGNLPRTVTQTGPSSKFPGGVAGPRDGVADADGASVRASRIFKENRQQQQQALKPWSRSRSAPREAGALQRHVKRVAAQAAAAQAKAAAAEPRARSVSAPRLGEVPRYERLYNMSKAVKSPVRSEWELEAELRSVSLSEDDWRRVSQRLHDDAMLKMERMRARRELHAQSIDQGVAHTTQQRSGSRDTDGFFRRQERLLSRRAEMAAAARPRDEQELEECTWRPYILPSSQYLRRSVDELHAWDKRRQMRVEQMAQSIAGHELDGHTFHPEINHNSRTMAVARYAHAPDPQRPWTCSPADVLRSPPTYAKKQAPRGNSNTRSARRSSESAVERLTRQLDMMEQQQQPGNYSQQMLHSQRQQQTSEHAAGRAANAAGTGRQQGAMRVAAGDGVAFITLGTGRPYAAQHQQQRQQQQQARIPDWARSGRSRSNSRPSTPQKPAIQPVHPFSPGPTPSANAAKGALGRVFAAHDKLQPTLSGAVAAALELSSRGEAEAYLHAAGADASTRIVPSGYMLAVPAQQAAAPEYGYLPAKSIPEPHQAAISVASLLDALNGSAELSLPVQSSKVYGTDSPMQSDSCFIPLQAASSTDAELAAHAAAIAAATQQLLRQASANRTNGRDDSSDNASTKIVDDHHHQVQQQQQQQQRLSSLLGLPQPSLLQAYDSTLDVVSANTGATAATAPPPLIDPLMTLETLARPYELADSPQGPQLQRNSPSPQTVRGPASPSRPLASPLRAAGSPWTGPSYLGAEAAGALPSTAAAATGAPASAVALGVPALLQPLRQQSEQPVLTSRGTNPFDVDLAAVEAEMVHDDDSRHSRPADMPALGASPMPPSPTPQSAASMAADAHCDANSASSASGRPLLLAQMNTASALRGSPYLDSTPKSSNTPLGSPAATPAAAAGAAAAPLRTALSGLSKLSSGNPFASETTISRPAAPNTSNMDFGAESASRLSTHSSRCIEADMAGAWAAVPGQQSQQAASAAALAELEGLGMADHHLLADGSKVLRMVSCLEQVTAVSPKSGSHAVDRRSPFHSAESNLVLPVTGSFAPKIVGQSTTAIEVEALYSPDRDLLSPMSKTTAAGSDGDGEHTPPLLDMEQARVSDSGAMPAAPIMQAGNRQRSIIDELMDLADAM